MRLILKYILKLLRSILLLLRFAFLSVILLLLALINLLPISSASDENAIAHFASARNTWCNGNNYFQNKIVPRQNENIKIARTLATYRMNKAARAPTYPIEFTSSTDVGVDLSQEHKHFYRIDDLEFSEYIANVYESEWSDDLFMGLGYGDNFDSDRAAAVVIKQYTLEYISLRNSSSYHSGYYFLATEITSETERCFDQADNGLTSNGFNKNGQFLNYYEDTLEFKQNARKHSDSLDDTWDYLIAFGNENPIYSEYSESAYLTCRPDCEDTFLLGNSLDSQRAREANSVFNYTPAATRPYSTISGHSMGGKTINHEEECGDLPAEELFDELYDDDDDYDHTILYQNGAIACSIDGRGWAEILCIYYTNSLLISNMKIIRRAPNGATEGTDYAWSCSNLLKTIDNDCSAVYAAANQGQQPCSVHQTSPQNLWVGTLNNAVSLIWNKPSTATDTDYLPIDGYQIEFAQCSTSDDSSHAPNEPDWESPNSIRIHKEDISFQGTRPRYNVRTLSNISNYCHARIQARSGAGGGLWATSQILPPECSGKASNCDSPDSSSPDSSTVNLQPDRDRGATTTTTTTTLPTPTTTTTTQPPQPELTEYEKCLRNAQEARFSGRYCQGAPGDPRNSDRQTPVSTTTTLPTPTTTTTTQPPQPPPPSCSGKGCSSPAPQPPPPQPPPPSCSGKGC